MSMLFWSRTLSVASAHSVLLELYLQGVLYFDIAAHIHTRIQQENNMATIDDGDDSPTVVQAPQAPSSFLVTGALLAFLAFCVLSSWYGHFTTEDRAVQQQVYSGGR